MIEADFFVGGHWKFFFCQIGCLTIWQLLRFCVSSSSWRRRRRRRYWRRWRCQNVQNRAAFRSKAVTKHDRSVQTMSKAQHSHRCHQHQRQRRRHRQRWHRQQEHRRPHPGRVGTRRFKSNPNLLNWNLSWPPSFSGSKVKCIFIQVGPFSLHLWRKLFWCLFWGGGGLKIEVLANK